MTLQLLFFGITVFGSMSAIAAQEPNAQQCPEPADVAVKIPKEAFAQIKKLQVTVAARFDECGRILETDIIKRTRMRSFDTAVVDALKQSVISNEQRGKAIDGWYFRTFLFGIDDSLKSVSLDWPKSHAAPYYIADDFPVDFTSAKVADASIRDSNPKALRPPLYQFVHRIAQVDTPSGREFWLFIHNKIGIPIVAARFRPVMENSQPVVRFAIQCDLPADKCESVRTLLMRGLPMAPARQ